MGILVLLIACAVVGGAISGVRGRGQMFGFLLGALIGPIGVLIALFIPVPVAETERRLLRDGRMKTCPACAELVKRDALVCRYCGRDVSLITA